MIRLFVGLEIPDECIKELDGLREGVEGARWQRDDQLHLTLAFIGEVPNKHLIDIADTLSRIEVDPFDLALTGVNFFGKPGKPKALWIGVEDKQPLLHLHEKINHALLEIGLDVETRKFTPHVTLARFKRGATARIGNWLSSNETLKTQPALINEFCLFSSQLTSERAYYSVEANFQSRAYASHTLDVPETEAFFVT
jgi:2'-5' RNA ligase